MSVIRHPSFFHRRVSRNGKTELFRDFGTFEKILLVARETFVKQVKETLEKNFFDVRCASDIADATDEISHNAFEVVICDTGLPDFPLPTLYSAVEHQRPELLDRFIFLVDAQTRSDVVEFIERVDGLKVWRPLELIELFQMIEIVLGRSAMLAMT